nr:siderophore ABC transporter substrate-binding protein [Tropicimonas sediminicola]
MLSTASAAETVSIETARGPVEAPEVPATIAAFDVAAIDTLDALGVTVAAVPQPLYVPYLEDLTGIAQPVGSLFEPDFEALAILAPDLIVAGGRSSSQVDALARIAPTLDMTISGDTLIADAKARIDAYGTLMGLEDKAAELKAGLDAKLTQARAAVDGKGDALILMANGPKISAYGAGSRFGWLHRELALPEAVEGVDVQTHGEAVSFEFVAEADPDWLIVVDRGAAIGEEGAGAAETLDNQLVAGTKAWKNGHVIYVDPASIYIAGGGVQSITGILDQLIAAFEG